MSIAVKERLFTPDEYLEMERLAEAKSEYIDGRIYAMLGASVDHNQITINVAASAWIQLKGKSCRAYTSDLRVQAGRGRKFFYPDVVIVCGTPQFRDDATDTLLNPTAIIEILSSSTERFDQGRKGAAYRALPTLQEYILIAQDRIHIERYLRNGDEWTFNEIVTLDAAVEITSAGCVLPVADIYDRVPIEAEAD